MIPVNRDFKIQWLKKIIQLSAIVLLLLFCVECCGQTRNDSLAARNKSSNIFQTALNAFKRSGEDTTREPGVLNTKSIVPYLPLQGKIIRKIEIREYGFEKSFTDTSKRIAYFGTRILNSLHRNTREWVIRNNLFIKVNSKLDAYLVADNERYLRSLNYIQDARILVNVLPENPDSVDLVVITKDLFSLNVQIGELSPSRIQAAIGDVNVLGMGQQVEIAGLLQQKRRPKFGSSILYSKNNVAHTFINATAAYTQFNNDLTDNSQDEHAIYLRLDRPLISPYSHIAGGMLLGYNQTYNNYRKPEEKYYNYRYSSFDIWAGYNLGVKKLLENKKSRDQKFVSLRYFNTNFKEVPFQVGNGFNSKYNDRQGLLSQFTFFRQEYFKTNYLYGFGTTEDVPYGYNVALTTGWYKQLELSRPYFGIDANRYLVSGKGDFLQYFLRSGLFLNQGKIQDGSILLGAGLFSHLFLIKNMKLRQYLRMSVSKQFNRLTYDPLKINNPFGLRYFTSDSVMGDRRLSLHSETFLFLKYKFFGFLFAPFAFADASILVPEKENLSKSGFYSGLGGGVRTRNENLVFGTIELRFIYFPRKTESNQSFKATLTTNLQFRNNSNYVKEPDLIQLNTDPTNTIY